MPTVKWDKTKLQLIRSYFEQGLSYAEIARKVGTTVDSLEHVARKHNLRNGLDRTSSSEAFDPNNAIDTVIEGKRIKKQELDILAGLIGEKIYKNFQVVKLETPSLIKAAGTCEETSILDISDVHVGMINEASNEATGGKEITYNHEIFLSELKQMQESIFQIHQLLSHKDGYRLRKLVIHILGDIITNDRIFPEQTFEIEHCVGLQMWDAVTIFSQFFVNLLRIYEEIEVVCVAGNHGRSNPTHYNEPVQNNFEYHIYRIWQKQFENHKQIKIIVPEAYRYIHKIGPWRHLIEHGHNLKGFSETSIKNQLKEMFVNVGNFDVFHFGHIHELADKSISDKVIVKQNGCWIWKDEYAWTKFKTFSIPKQHFFGCNDRRAETWKYALDLRTK